MGAAVLKMHARAQRRAGRRRLAASRWTRALPWAAAEVLAFLGAAAALSQGCNRVSCEELHDPACWIPPAEAGSDADGALDDDAAVVGADADAFASSGANGDGASSDVDAD